MNTKNENDKSTNTQQSEWKDRDIGALWKREGASQKYLTGKVVLDGVEKKIVVFSNKHKTKDSQPDFRIYLSKEMDSNSSEKKQVSENEDLL